MSEGDQTDDTREWMAARSITCQSVNHRLALELAAWSRARRRQFWERASPVLRGALGMPVK